MRIGVLYNRDAYANKALNLLLPELSGHTVALFHSTGIGKSSTEVPDTLQALRVAESTLLPPSHGQLISQRGETRLGFDALAQRYGISDCCLNHLNTPDGLSLLADFAPDLLLSIRFGKILKAEAIACPTNGVINLHSGPLPAYRGVMPTFWGMLNGESKIGTTLHWILDHTIDTGTPIGGTSVPVVEGVSYMANVWQLYDQGITLMLAAVAAVDTGQLERGACLQQYQPVCRGDAYYTFPVDADLQRFSALGLTLFEPTDLEVIGAVESGAA